nr:hypothetical protein OH826_17775 [Streptomyces sp. NBC_00899]
MSSESGHVKPIKSKHQAHPWQPTVESSDGTQSAAGKDYTDVYGGKVNSASGDSGKGDGRHEKSGREPILKMAYTTAPDLVAPADSGGTGQAAAMESGRFSIQLFALLSAEQTCLNATSAMVAGYGTLKTVVDKAASDDNYFGQLTGHPVANQPDGGGRGGWYGDSWVPDAANAESKEFAATIIPQMKNLLNTIGNVIEACGQFNALLNNAGQSYATMDSKAEFKDA